MSKDTSPDTEQTVEIIQRYEGSLVGYSVDKGKTFHPSVKEAFDHLTTPISPTENTEDSEGEIKCS